MSWLLLSRGSRNSGGCLDTILGLAVVFIAVIAAQVICGAFFEFIR